MPETIPDLDEKPLNAALFARFSAAEFLVRSLAALPQTKPVIVVSESDLVVHAVTRTGPFTRANISFDPLLFDEAMVLNSFRSLLQSQTADVVLLVDLSWVTDALDGARVIDIWSSVTEQLVADFGCHLVSLYNVDLLVENRVQSALRAHRQMLAPSGVHENPFWLPSTMASGGTLDEQMLFLLGRAVPDYKDMKVAEAGGRSFARGANPQWLPTPKHLEVVQQTETRWLIHCLGPLRVYKEGHQWVNWKLKGGSPNKTRALFAYLLQAGEKGAHVDRIGEFLWSSSVTEKVKRARLHHAVAMLRKTLDGSDSVLRMGEHYRLNAPAGSWIDISGFEQTCRRGLALFKQGQVDEALRVYLSAEGLYSGDLFEDIPVEYVHSELDDWCLPRRRWLREMAIKLFCDMSVLLRDQDRTDDALDKCQKALKLDPASDDANAEAMRIFHAQGRTEAITRQYRQYLSAVEAIGGSSERAAIHRLHSTLAF